MAKIFRNFTLLITLILASPAQSKMVEDLWVIDSSLRSTNMMIEVIDHIEVYFRELRDAGVQSAGVFLSADALTNKRNPFHSEQGVILLTTEQGDLFYDWNERTADAWVKYPDVSPIWVLEMFYRRLHKIPVYKKGYQMPNIPSNVQIFSAWDDGFHKFTLDGPKEFWGPEDFTQSFQDYHSRDNKPYTINAVVRVRKDPEAPPGGIDMAYEQITKKTDGKLYPWEPGKPMGEIMRDLAKRSISRAR